MSAFPVNIRRFPNEEINPNYSWRWNLTEILAKMFFVLTTQSQNRCDYPQKGQTSPLVAGVCI